MSPAVAGTGMGRTVWVKSPLAILADGAGGGVVVRGSTIVELVASLATPIAVGGHSAGGNIAAVLAQLPIIGPSQ